MCSFPHLIDSTMVNDFRRCPTRWAERYIHLLELPGENVDLKFGSCFARGLEVARKNYYMQGLTSAESISLGLQAAARDWGYFDEPQGHVKSFDTLMLAIDGYYQTSEEIDVSLRNRPAQARLEGDTMKITPLN